MNNQQREALEGLLIYKMSTAMAYDSNTRAAIAQGGKVGVFEMTDAMLLHCAKTYHEIDTAPYEGDGLSDRHQSLPDSDAINDAVLAALEGLLADALLFPKHLQNAPLIEAAMLARDAAKGSLS